MSDRTTLISHFDRTALLMENLADFYDWVIAVFARYQLRKGSRIVDVGCGTGALLRRLHEAGYSNLSGADFAPGCLTLARQQAPFSRFYLHDIEAGPLPERYDVALLTTVIDFVDDPGATLSNLRQSLGEDGLLFVTIRNRRAYFPWYYLQPLERLLRFSPRFTHWFLWLTTPLAMRRDDWQVERMYAPGEMRRLLRGSGFEILNEFGSQMLPMLWIPDMPRVLSLMRAIEHAVGVFVPSWLKFRYMFVCRPCS